MELFLSAIDKAQYNFFCILTQMVIGAKVKQSAVRDIKGITNHRTINKLIGKKPVLRAVISKQLFLKAHNIELMKFSWI